MQHIFKEMSMIIIIYKKLGSRENTFEKEKFLSIERVYISSTLYPIQHKQCYKQNMEKK